MNAPDSVLEKYSELKKKRLTAFFRNTILLALLATALAVGFTWLEMRNVFFFTFLALIPGGASVLWDRKPGRFASKSVCAFNLTGMFPYILSISLSGNADTTAQNFMKDPLAWTLIYGFSAIGWGVIYVIPKITLILLEIRSKFMISKMEKYQQDLVDEWGDEVRK